MGFLRVDLGVLKSNFFKANYLASGAQVYCVVKSDAYGCGMEKIAKTLQDLGASGFVVADVAEGVTLRQAGITKPITVLGYTCLKDLSVLKKYNLTQSVFNVDYLKVVKDFAKQKFDGKKLDLWLKLNCGFNRVGFGGLELERAFLELCEIKKEMEFSVLFAHLRDGGATQATLINRAKKQFEEFCNLTKIAKSFSPLKNTKLSLLNSGGLIMGLPSLDIVRTGALLYGLTEGSIPIVSFFANVLQVNTLETGQGMGYDDSFVAEKTTKIAVLDVGYADGLPRRASDLGLRAFVGGKYHPFVGSVCMNHSFVAVDEDVSVFSTAEIIGKNILPKEVAQKLKTIDYEIFCRFGKNSKKIYVD